MEMQAYKPEVHHIQNIRTSFAGETGSYKVIEIKYLPKVVLPGKDKISMELLVGWQMENISFQSREELKNKKEVLDYDCLMERHKWLVPEKLTSR